MLLSIITINRNNLSGLQDTVRSVLDQTDQNFEWIVIDGASTDGGAEFTRSINRPNTIAISEPDRGIYDAMNKGIDLCHGDFCLFLNSGDIFQQDDSLARCLTEMQKRPEADVFRFAIAETLNSKVLQIVHPAEKITGLFLFNNTIPHQATVIRTFWLRKYHYNTVYKITADGDFFRKLYCFEEIKDVVIDKILTHYDCSGISSMNSENIIEERKQSFIALLGHLVYVDYHRFVCGETAFEKWIAKFRTSRCFTVLALCVLSPLYLLWCFLSLMVNFKWFFKRIKARIRTRIKR